MSLLAVNKAIVEQYTSAKLMRTTARNVRKLLWPKMDHLLALNPPATMKCLLVRLMAVIVT